MDLDNNQNVQNVNNVAAVGNEEPPEDFRTLSIVPTVQELNNNNIFLRAAKIKEKYDSVNHYLDVQFRLLREDFLIPLRRGLDDYLTHVGEKGHRNNDLRIYRKVKLIPVEKGVGIKAFFGKLSYINWQQSKRLMHGGLLMLSNDNFQTILFVTVGDRDKKELEEGFVSITLCNENLKITKQMYDAEYVMLESKIFFEPYMSVLSAMKQIDDDDFPMKNYLIEANNVINSPEYLRPVRTLKYKNLTLPIHDDARSWPTAQQLGLDETQYNAFRHALTEEFALIQGPPGTGKTFIALEIVRTFLQNKSCWKSLGPIVVVCYTNHALDQFLEGILKHTKSIVRIGGQSKSDVLKPYTLVNKRRDPNRIRNRNHNVGRNFRDAKDRLEDIENNLKNFHWYIKKLSTQGVILPLRDITSHYTDPEVAKIKCNTDFLQWLFQEVAPQTLQSLPLPENVESFEYKYVKDLINEDFEYFSPVIHLESKLWALKEYIQNLNKLEMAPEKKSYIIIQLRHYQMDLTQQLQQLKNQFAHQPLQQQQPRRKHRHGLPEMNNRWRIYWNLIIRHYEHTLDSIARLEISHRRLNSQINEMRSLLDIDIFEAHEIIGLTTTSAARLYKSLRNLTAPIVLVEEAAEIFETHVVSSMTRHCKHVILIGDHKQLQPKTSTYEIGKKYNLSISLFERMINIRGGSCPQLAHQHRMRPEIAKLITPSIYEVLHNHESVYEHADVKGLEKNLFFLDHNNPETNCDNESSWSNEFEAKFLIAFAIHLVKQGYQTTDITILCTYTGQLMLLRKEKGKHTILQGTFVTTVDNYQGEENKIILLSLVRNNGEGKVGFLKEENRVCVALSRAREGLFIMGNMSDLIFKNNIWPQIKHVLEQQHAIGDCIEVRCQIHPEVLTQIRKFEDFNELCPEGGCSRKCQSVLNCGHVCTKNCHILDREHKNYKCMEKCTKSCPFNHPCKLKCWQDCGPCPEMVERKLKCGHTVQMPCSSDPETFYCYIQIDVILPDCEHEMTKACALPIEKCVCPHDCDNRLLCGHVCSKKCHVKKDPDHLEYKCVKECAKIYQDCENNHPCRKRCYEDCGMCPEQVDKLRSCGHFYKKAKCSIKIDDQPCVRPCKLHLPCGHKCPMKCSDLCGNCKVEVTKDSTCGHKIKVKCSEAATPLKCSGRCSKKLPNCGHPCTNRCKDACTVKCEAAVKLDKPGLCGHIFSVPCYLRGNDSANPSLLKYCKEPCRTTLECQHRCSGNCGECLQDRIHKPCSAPCQKILVCGHQCDIPCKKDCQPCTRKCEIRCSHSKCNQKCGYPCITCKEKCKIGCIHRQCSKRCDQICDIEPCNEPCPKILKCGHPCVGFCGDPCPPLCRICNKDELTEIFFGTEEDTDARFVFLKDCKHTIESEGLMNWMKSSTDESNQSVSIGMKRCPKCSTEIKDCMRMSNQIKAHLQDVLRVKEQIYAKDRTKKQLEVDQLKHVETLNKLLKNGEQLKEFEELHNLMQDMSKRGALTNNKRRQILSMPELNAFKVQLDILIQINHILSTAKHKEIPLFTIVKDQIKMLARTMPNSWFITAQTLQDIQRELQRLSYMVALCNLGNTTCIELEAVKALILSPQKFTSALEEQMKIKIKDLERIINQKITIEERQMIVKAVGLSQGHWYKCPNGHVYVITECGGAMQVGICNECNEPIGGTSHQLLRSNALASEMDGATRPAWPQ